MSCTHLDRRKFVQITATTALTGTLLAGCTDASTDSGSNSGSDGNSGDDPDNDSTDGESPTDPSRNETSGFGNWFDDVENYSGVVDESGADSVTITVGAEGNGDAYAYEPAAVKISTGTTVVWEWSGDGGTHNVVDEGGAFESELVDDEGHTFEHTFDKTGTYKYLCEPHEPMGMKGGIIVE